MTKPRTPSARIEGYERDEEGVWVAQLDCGHRQHLRHTPPWQNRAWVETEEGRTKHLGAALPCPACRMPKLPPEAVEYKRVGPWGAADVPKGLLASHRLKAGSWGEIVVTEGRVLYVLEDDDDFGIMLRPGLTGIVAPERPHHIAPELGAVLHVRFLRI